MFSNEEETEAAFSMFDRDLNGDISCEEMELSCVENRHESARTEPDADDNIPDRCQQRFHNSDRASFTCGRLGDHRQKHQDQNNSHNECKEIVKLSNHAVEIF